MSDCVIGDWVLGIGAWGLGTGDWVLGIGYWVLAFIYSYPAPLLPCLFPVPIPYSPNLKPCLIPHPIVIGWGILSSRVCVTIINSSDKLVKNPKSTRQ